MGQRKRDQDQEIGSYSARSARRLLVVAFASALLAACGGGGGGSSPTAAPSRTASDSSDRPGGPDSAGGAHASGGSGGDEEIAAAPAAAKGAATLTWTPPTMNDDGTPLKLTGYRIYWGRTEGNYPHSVTLNNPGLTRYVVEDLAPATWYFVATALSAEAESPPSNVIVMRVE